MKRIKPTIFPGSRILLVAAAIFLCLQPPAARAFVQGDHWVGTWAAAPLHPDLRSDPRGVQAITLPETVAPGVTIRETVRVSMGGGTVRVRFSNLDGDAPLVIGKADIAQGVKGSATKPGSDRALSFHGRPSVSIPPGALVISDPVQFPLAPLSDMAVTFYVPTRSGRVTEHQLASATSYHVAGDHVSEAELVSPEQTKVWEFLNGIDVLAPAKAGAIVVIGDSITDGAYSTIDANQRWPDELARRLQSDKKYNSLSVLNEAISGNKVLQERAGPSALSRFDRDVLAQSGLRYLIILEGINDINNLKSDPTDRTDANDLIFAMDQMITRAHAHGVIVIGGTLTPYGGARAYSDIGESVRLAVNEWIRTGGAFDRVIDFEAAVRDPQHPNMFLPAYDHGDHLHPGDVGYKAMGDAIDLNVFRPGSGK